MLSQFFSITAAACQTSNFFFGMVPWYGYLPAADFKAPADIPASVVAAHSGCTVYNFTILGSSSDIPLILLAVVDDLLRIAGLVAVGYLIYAGVRYITSQGSPDQTAKAQGTIINALVGLAIALIAVVLVSYLGTTLRG